MKISAAFLVRQFSTSFPVFRASPVVTIIYTLDLVSELYSIVIHSLVPTFLWCFRSCNTSNWFYRRVVLSSSFTITIYTIFYGTWIDNSANLRQLIRDFDVGPVMDLHTFNGHPWHLTSAY